MNRQTIKEFLAAPMVKEAMRTDGPKEVGRMAIMVGNLERDQDLREFGEMLIQGKLPAANYSESLEEKKKKIKSLLRAGKPASILIKQVRDAS